MEKYSFSRARRLAQTRSSLACWRAKRAWTLRQLFCCLFCSMACEDDQKARKCRDTMWYHCRMLDSLRWPQLLEEFPQFAKVEINPEVLHPICACWLLCLKLLWSCNICCWFIRVSNTWLWWLVPSWFQAPPNILKSFRVHLSRQWCGYGSWMIMVTVHRNPQNRNRRHPGRLLCAFPDLGVAKNWLSNQKWDILMVGFVGISTSIHHKYP